MDSAATQCVIYSNITQQDSACLAMASDAAQRLISDAIGNLAALPHVEVKSFMWKHPAEDTAALRPGK
jgi:hypothetical protein